MKHQMRINIQDAAECMTYVRELRESGLVQGKDFDFWYYPYAYNVFSGEEHLRHVLVCFASESTATFYRVKWL